MRVEKVKQVASRDGVPFYRVRLRSHDGRRHGVIVPQHALAHPLSFGRFCRERLGRELVAEPSDPGEWCVAVGHALAAGTPPVPRNEGGYVPPAAAGAAVTMGTEDACVRNVALKTYGALQALINTGSGDPDALHDLLSAALAELEAMDY